ncbi:MAG: M20/M25/M40 family metallo-hydrolase, partial [Gammaproteobacteria bacterium]|nr:M20/M25/M40 family metallo-hydrolase [Gammaproteobacteria bacterium]
GESNTAFLEEIQACAGSGPDWEVPFRGEPLPAAGQGDADARALCRRLELPLSAPVDFWTEASMFSAAGLPALVLGPGHIAQAHAADEWVELDQLQTALELYTKVVTHDG